MEMPRRGRPTLPRSDDPMSHMPFAPLRPRLRPMRRQVLFAAVLAAALASHPVGATAQSPTPPGTELLDASASGIPVLLLGTFHFDDPGLDAYKSRHDADMLSPARQREVEDVVERLAAFRPTRIAVEWPRERQAALDSLFREYRAGRLAPRRSEVFQLGFRLAARLGHDRVHAIDVERNQALMDAVMPYERDLVVADSVDAWRPRYRQWYAWEDSIKTTRSLRTHLRYLSSPERIRRSHGAYFVGYFRGGDDTSYVGPDFVAGWFNRNLRIFRNMQRIAGDPSDRLLLIYGAGHLATLGQFVESSPEYRLEDAERYLGEQGAH